jgi:hypothetical protein
MALLTVEGIYKDGKVELSERPGQVNSPTRVIVTFLPAGVPVTETAPGADVDRETLRQRAFARMEEGLHLGGAPYPSREELHERSR